MWGTGQEDREGLDGLTPAHTGQAIQVVKHPQCEVVVALQDQACMVQQGRVGQASLGWALENQRQLERLEKKRDHQREV